MTRSEGMNNNKSIKILLTNWINLLGVFLVAFACAFLLTFTDANLSYNIFQSMLAALFLVYGFGMMFWALFIVSLIVLDLLLIVPGINNLKTKLTIEWLVIISPFVYWTVKYHEWIFAGCYNSFFFCNATTAI